MYHFTADTLGQPLIGIIGIGATNYTIPNIGIEWEKSTYRLGSVIPTMLNEMKLTRTGQAYVQEGSI